MYNCGSLNYLGCVMDNISKLDGELRKILQVARDDRRDADFYLRILVQAALANGGELIIDPSFADAAFAALTTSRIEFGNGKVTVTALSTATSK